MLSVAFFYDVLQGLFNLIPFIGQILSLGVVFLSFFTFFIWFKMHDVGFLERFGAKKILAYVAVPIIEVMTLGVAPGITFAVGITIAIVRFEDKLIKEGVVTREDLKRLENAVIKTGKIHGFDSPHFNRELARSLGRDIKERYASKLPPKVLPLRHSDPPYSRKSEDNERKIKRAA